ALTEALKKLGAEFVPFDGKLKVRGVGGRFNPYRGEIDVGPAGTTMRFLISLCAFIEGVEVVLRGTERMHKRPVKELVSALRHLGADIEYLGDEGCPPLRIKGRGGLSGGTVRMKGDLSSQYFSSLLMAAPLLENGVTIEV